MKIGLLVYLARGCGEEGIDERGGEMVLAGGIKLSLGRYRAALPLGVYYQLLQRGEVLPNFVFTPG